MRHLRAYKWKDVLEEEVPITLIGLECIKREREAEKREIEKAKIRRKR